MKNKTFTASIVCAARGLAYAVKTEKNYRYYALLLLLTLLLNTYLKAGISCHLFTVLTAAGACSAECLNTAVEHMMDKIEPSLDKEAGLIKDIAASGVLCWGICYLIIEGYVLWRYFFWL